jgi:ABC-type transporter Mla maintaining outer membrane lipid asymmetry ATPase subunit MlaF
MTAPLRFEAVPLPGLSDGGLTLAVPAHRAVSIHGPEASGVATLAAYALGMRPPPGGRVLVFDEDLARMSRSALLAFRRRLGYLPAGDGLLHNLTLRDNVALPLRFGSAMSEREIVSRLRIMLGQLRISEAADLRPADATEEQRRRAALARALAFDPELVILESPFDGLTPRTASELLEIAMGGETAEGSRRTLFLTGHYVPAFLERRIDVRYRLVRGSLDVDT